MRKKSLEYRILVLVVSLVLAVFKASPQRLNPPLVSALPEEAPTSLFAASIGDNEVELFIQGYWEASVQSTGSLFFGGSAAAAFNATPLLFIQRPDLYLLLVFRKQWWLEASIADDIERATWALGYTGKEEDFLKTLRLGNTGIQIPDYPFMSFGAPTGAFGAVLAGRDESRGTALDAMIRWDGLSWKSRTFSGLAETVETLIQPRDQLRGRRFVLPDENLTSLVVYDYTSSGRRVLQADEYSVSLARGILELKAEPKGVLSVVYALGGGPPEEEIGLYRKPGTDPPSAPIVGSVGQEAEARNLYALSDSLSRRELFVRNHSSGQPDLRFEVRESSSGLIEVVKSGTVGPRPPEPAGDWHDYNYRRPFSVAAIGDTDGQDWIYEDEPEAGQHPLYPASEGFAIVARSLETIEAIVLGKEAVPGSITVFRDGVQSEAYVFESSGGTLELFPPPRAGESILVRYAVTSADRDDGALVFAAGARFPWLGLDWSVALGGRWALPGVAYATGSELKPAWTGLALGLEHREDEVRFGAKAVTKYSRASAASIYRVAGMEDAAGFQSPFRPVNGDTQNFEIASVLETGLADAFPELMAKLHPGGRTNKALSIQARDGGGEIELLRYSDPIPLAAFGGLSFFIKTEDLGILPDTIMLELKVRGGEDGAGGLTVTVPIHQLPPGWYKVEVRLNPVHPGVRILSSSGQIQDLSPPPGASFVYTSQAGELRLSLTGLSEGIVYIDEIVLESAEDGLSAQFALELALGKASTAQFPYLQADLTGVIDKSISVGAGLVAGWLAGPSEWNISLAPLWSEDYASTSFGYTLALPSRSSSTRIMDQYSQDTGSGGFARNLSGEVGLDKFSVGLEAGVVDTAARFSQNWKGSAAWGGIASLGVEMGLVVTDGASDEQDPGSTWMESWQLLLPSRESDASTRRLQLNATFAESRLLFQYRQDFTAPGTVATTAMARSKFLFSLGVFGFEPFLERRIRLTEAGSPQDFSEDIGFATDRAGTLFGPFAAIPLYDLFEKDLETKFIDSTSAAEAALYYTRAGLAIRRPIGYGVADLVIPNALEFHWARSFETRLDSRIEYHDLSMKASSAAVNLFGFRGVRPRVEGLAYDEYASTLDFSARYHLDDGTLLPSITARNFASLETLQGATIAVASRFSLIRSRTGSQVRETLSLSLGKKPDRSWLGDLVDLILSKPRETLASRSDEEDNGGNQADGEGNSISRWFDSLARDTLVLRDSFDTSITLAKEELPGSSSVKFSLAYATRVLIPGSLSIGFRSSLDPSIRFRLDGWTWGIGYEFAIDGRVSF